MSLASRVVVAVSSIPTSDRDDGWVITKRGSLGSGEFLGKIAQIDYIGWCFVLIMHCFVYTIRKEKKKVEMKS